MLELKLIHVNKGGLCSSSHVQLIFYSHACFHTFISIHCCPSKYLTKPLNLMFYPGFSTVYVKTIFSWSSCQYQCIDNDILYSKNVKSHHESNAGKIQNMLIVVTSILVWESYSIDLLSYPKLQDISWDLDSVSIFDRTSYCRISSSIEAARFVFRSVRSFWNLTGTSAAPLPMCLPNFKAMW